MERQTGPAKAEAVVRPGFQAAAYLSGAACLVWLVAAHATAVLHPGSFSREPLAAAVGTVLVAFCAWRAGDSRAEGVGGGAFFLVMAGLLWVSQPAYDTLIRKSEGERLIAARVAGAKDAAELTARLGEALSDPDPLTRLGAALRLRALRDAAAPAKAQLVKAADDPDALVSDAAREALAMLPRTP